MDNLKKSITQELENTGFLKKIRAELRKNLLQAAEVYENKGEPLPLEKAAILDTELGQICAALVKDFLDTFKMTYTLSVFVPESHLSDDRSDIEELEQMFQVKSGPGKPLLFSVIEFLMQNAEEEGSQGERLSNKNVAEEDSISEDIVSIGESEGDFTKRDEITESQGTSSLGADASVNSLAIEEYDHIEPVRKNRLAR